jgi:ribosomal protein L21E
VSQFKIGDRVKRDETNLIINWSSHKVLHGTVSRVYSEQGMFGFYPELYEVNWDDGDKYNKGCLPHGLELEEANT